MLGWFNPNLGKIWTKCWVKNAIKKIHLKVKVEVGSVLHYIFNPTFGFVHI